jgi:agmatine deiminase
MPAEWEPQEAVWLSWPANPETWPPHLLAGARRAYVEVIRSLAPSQAVCLLAANADAGAEAASELTATGVDTSGVRVHEIPTTDTWIRDYGPTFLLNDESGEVGMVEWRFNAWGDKYDDLQADDGIPSRINRLLNLRAWNPGIVMEGGSIEVNGRGTVLTTEQCLLNENRNPGLGRREIEGFLADYLAAPNVLWLGEGIVGDDTDGHIDDIARFVDERTVVCALEEDPADANFELLADNHRRLQAFRDQDGRELGIIALPMPDPVLAADPVTGGATDDVRLPASYANFYIGNGTVLVPVFGQKGKDGRALEVLRGVFPSRKVIGIDCRALVHGRGTLHCCSQQQPKGK